MSDIASLRQLERASCQLPVSWYFDPAILEQEKKLLFDAGANYVGHELMVPEVGDWHSLAWMDHARVLVRHSERAPGGASSGVERSFTQGFSGKCGAPSSSPFRS